MADPDDDTSTADTSSDAEDPSAYPSDDADRDTDAHTPSKDESTSVAATAGIDDDVLEVPRELSGTVRFQWVVRSTISAAIFAVVVAVVTFVVASQTAFLGGDAQTAVRMGVAVFTLAVLLGVVRAVLLYRSWRYVIRPDSLYLSRGVLTRVRTVVPYVRVQHIDTTRSPLERLLGLSTLVVYTAGSRGADVTIPGLTSDRASTLQGRLERLAIESEEADAV